MAIRCVFLLGLEGSPCSCEVLRALGAVPLQGTEQKLRDRYCSTGAFIGCPVFRRVEEGLLHAELLRARAEPQPIAVCA